MTLTDIIIKILLFFIVFYGAIMLTSFVSKRIRGVQDNEEKDRDDKK